MSQRISVGNLSLQTTEQNLVALFTQIGQVKSVTIITDRDTDQSQGCACVEMGDEDAAQAIAQLNGVEVGGRALTVNAARPHEERGGRRGDGGHHD